MMKCTSKYQSVFLSGDASVHDCAAYSVPIIRTLSLLGPDRKPMTQMAARETGFGAVEQFMHAGKLLALELLVRALESPHHHWPSLRPEARTPP